MRCSTGLWGAKRLAAFTVLCVPHLDTAIVILKVHGFEGGVFSSLGASSLIRGIPASSHMGPHHRSEDPS